MSSDSQRPDDATIDAWLEGLLPTEEAARIDAWFEEHPEVLNQDSFSSELLQEASKIAEHNQDIPELIDLLKTRPPETPISQHSQSWRDVLAPPTREDSIGALGHYEILEIIAAGGMGLLFKAYDAKLDRLAAIKLLAPEFAINSTSRKRFLREARAAAKLEHENILPIYGVYDEAVPWFAMRFVAGGSLQDTLDTGDKLPDIKSLGLQLASALQAAHEAGIVHRDLKPANILLGKERIWLCDFGIAQTTQEPSLTMSGVLAGTPQYMSPEQAEGILLDGRSDLFSLGAVLYHCATGRPPFSGKTTTSILQKIATADHTKPNILNPNLPKWFGRLLENLLAKDPNDRFLNAGEVIKAIESERAPRPKWHSRRKAFLCTIAASIILLCSLLQIPSIKFQSSKILAHLLDRPFIIQGNLIPITTLEKAIETAEGGSTILLPGEDLIYLDNISVPAQKTLTFAPRDPQNRPTLTVKEPGIPGIRAYSTIHLTGLNFQHNTHPDGNALLIFHCDASLSDCSFRGGWKWKPGMSKIHARTLETRKASELEITNCHFELEKTTSLVIRNFQHSNEPTKITFRHCSIKAVFAVNAMQYTPKSPLQIVFEDTIFNGVSTLKMSGKAAPAHIHVEALRSDFKNTGQLVWFRTPKYKIPLKHFRWRDEKSSYTPGYDQAYFGYGANVSDAVLVKPISAFQK